MRFASGLTLTVVAAALVGCGEGEDLTGPAAGPPGVLLVSDLVAAPGSSGTPAAPQAFASLPAGSIPGGRSAVLRDLAGGASLAASLVDGGLDPVAFTA